MLPWLRAPSSVKMVELCYLPEIFAPVVENNTLCHLEISYCSKLISFTITSSSLERLSIQESSFLKFVDVSSCPNLKLLVLDELLVYPNSPLVPVVDGQPNKLVLDPNRVRSP